MVKEVTLELTNIIVKDKKTGYFSSFFAQFPEAIAQGKTEEEALTNLLNIFKVMMDDKKEEVLRHYDDNIDYTSKSVNLVPA